MIDLRLAESPTLAVIQSFGHANLVSCDNRLLVRPRFHGVWSEVELHMAAPRFCILGGGEEMRR